MSLPDYVSTTSLPTSPLLDTWTASEPYIAPLQSDMEGGNVRLRSKPGRNRARFKFDIRFTKAQFITFKSFVNSTLNFGSSRFTMRVYLGDGTFATKTVQFASPYSEKTEEPTIIVSFDLYVWG